LTNIDVQSFHIFYVDGVTWTGGDVGPADSDTIEHAWIGEWGNWAAKNVVLEGINFHDFTQGTASGSHTECLLITTADNVTVRGNRFKHCDSTGAIYATEINFSDPNGYCLGLVIENNMFIGTNGGSGPKIENDCQTVIRNNSFAGDAGLSLEDWQSDPGNGPSQTVTVVGNYGAMEGCSGLSSYFAFRDNVWLNRACDATDLAVGALNFVDSASDLHLTAGANAIDKGNPSSYPATDIDGQTRFMGSAPDAGVDER